MEYTVRIHKKNKVIEVKAEKGVNVLKFLRDQKVDVKAPCGGKGTCGKCKVQGDIVISMCSSHCGLIGKK